MNKVLYNDITTKEVMDLDVIASLLMKQEVTEDVQIMSLFQELMANSLIYL